MILVTFGYEFHLAQLFPFPASARTSKSAHSFASYRPANQTHLGVSLWEINPVLLWSVCHCKVSLLTGHPVYITFYSGNTRNKFQVPGN